MDFPFPKLTWREIRDLRKKNDRESRDAREEAWDQISGPFLRLTQQIQQSCGLHTRGHYHDNGLGWAWWYCRSCDSRMDIHYYLTEEEPSED
jgi:hypothetical protein